MLWLTNILIQMVFTKELLENNHEMVIFLLLLCKIVRLQHTSLITQSIPMDPKHSVIEGLHCITIKDVKISYVLKKIDQIIRKGT